MQLRELTEVEFNEFVNSNSMYSIYQTVEYANTMKNEKCDILYVGLTNENKIIAASLILVKKVNGFKYAYAPRGFLIDYDNYSLLEEFTIGIKKLLKSKDIVAVKLSPMILKKETDKDGEILYSNPKFDEIYEYLKKLDYYHFGFNNYFEGDKPRYEAIIKLEGNDASGLFNNIDKKYRTKIRSALKKGIKIFKGNEEHINYIYEHSKNKYLKNQSFYINIYNEFNKDNSVDFFYAKIDTKEYLDYCKGAYEKQDVVVSNLSNEITNNNRLNKNNLINRKIVEDAKLDSCRKELIRATSLLKEHPSGIPVASIMSIKRNKEITIMMDGFDPKFKSVNAKHLLLWTLISKYNAEGFTSFNIGGVPGIKTNNPKYNGLKEFKLNFTPTITEYIGDLELITNNTLYFAYKQSKGISKMFEKKDKA